MKKSLSRDSRGSFRPSTGSKNTPLMRNTSRIPLSASMIMKTNQRESYIGTSNQHAVKDPRTLTDKSYIRRCVSTVIEILSELNYPHPITPKQFNPPSNKEYQRVFEFLTFEIMGSFRILGRPEEEMLKALKDLGYPYNISKSTLNNVGAMSCWPQAMGALIWIADYARYCSGIEESIEASMCTSPRKKLKQEFNYRCYSEFMTGNDGPFVLLESQLKDALDDLDADAMVKYEREKSNHAKLTAEYKQKLEEKESAEILAENIKTKKGNIEKIKQYLRQCEDYISVMKNKAKNIQESIKSEEMRLATSKEILIQLNAQVSQQDLNRADIEEIIREKQQLREAIRAATDRLDQIKKIKWDLDVKLGKLSLESNELAGSFNTQFKNMFNSLSLIKDHLPEEFQRLNIADFTLSFGHKGLENGDILAKTIEPFLGLLNSKMLEVLGSLDTEYHNTCKRVKQSGEVLADLTKQKEQLQDQHQKLVKESEAAAEELKKSEELYSAKIFKAETTLEQLKSAQAESVEELTSQKEEGAERYKTLLEKNKRMNAAEISSLENLKISVKKYQETLHEMAKEFVEKINEVDQDALNRLEGVKAQTTELKESVEHHNSFIKQLSNKQPTSSQ